MGHWALGIGHWAWGIGHGALVLSVAVGAASRREVWGIGHWAWGK
nr:hypothetical protein [Nostoc sp. ZfuVER08]